MAIPALTLALLAVALLLAVGLAYLIHRRRSRLPQNRLAKCSVDLLSQVLLPNDDDGQIHLEYLLLSPRGIIVLNLKNVAGNVFGSDAMQEWAVLTGKSRFGFRNPQDGLFDRVAAVKRLVPDTVPVHGYIAFGQQARFTKGIPSHTVMFEELVAELQQELAHTNDAGLPRDAWEKLKAVAMPGSE